MTEALSHQVQAFFVKSGLVMVGFAPTLTYCDADSSVVEEALMVSVLVLQSIFVSDRFGPTGKQWKRFVLVSGKNEPKQSM